MSKIKEVNDISRVLSEMRQIDLARLESIWFYYDEDFDTYTHLTPMGSSKLSLIISGTETLDEEFDEVDMVKSLIDTLYILSHLDDDSESDKRIIRFFIDLMIEKLDFHYNP